MMVFYREVCTHCSIYFYKWQCGKLAEKLSLVHACPTRRKGGYDLLVSDGLIQTELSDSALRTCDGPQNFETMQQEAGHSLEIFGLPREMEATAPPLAELNAHVDSRIHIEGAPTVRQWQRQEMDVRRASA